MDTHLATKVSFDSEIRQVSIVCTARPDSIDRDMGIRHNYEVVASGKGSEGGQGGESNPFPHIATFTHRRHLL